MKIWQKIILGFISVIIIMIIVDSMALINNIQIINDVENLERSKRVELAQSHNIAFLIQRIKSNLRELFLEIEEGEREDEIIKARNVIEENMPEMITSIKIMRNATVLGHEMSEDEDEKEEESEELVMIDSLNNLIVHFNSDLKDILNLQDAHKYEEAEAFFEEHAEPFSRVIQDIINKIVDGAEEEVAWAIGQLNKKVDQALMHGIFLTILSVLLSLAIGFYIARSITDPLYKLIHGTKEIRNGNLETSVELKTKGELQVLANSFNKMTIELKNRIEAINKLNTELEDSNQTKDKYFSVIAHDLKNPFNLILGFSNLLCDKYFEYDDEKRFKIINHINTSSKVVYELLENLLTWVSSQRKKIELLPEKLNLNEVVEKCLGSYGGNAKIKNITVENLVPDNIPVFADRFTLTVVINNTVSNAVKFTPDNGTITIQAKTVDNKTELKISDNGIGMGQETIENLFQSKKILSKPGTRNEKGTGLGLMLIKDFITQNNGELFITSEAGKGTEFRFLLPSDIPV